MTRLENRHARHEKSLVDLVAKIGGNVPRVAEEGRRLRKKGERRKRQQFRGKP